MRVQHLFILLLLSAVPANAATLSGTALDSQGAAIADAHIIVHWDHSGSNYLKDNLGINEDMIATSDRNGQFSVELPSGFYDVFVTSTGFSPHCDKIRLKGKETKTYKVKLKVSEVTSKELD
jgi:hypothetical protein